MKRVHLLLTSLVVTVTTPLSAALPGVEPIVIKKEARLEKDHQQLRLEWAGKDLLPGARLAWKGKPWAADAERFCPAALAAWILDKNAATSLAELADQAAKLMAEGCDEPLACFLCHLCQYARVDNWRQGTAALEKVLSQPDTVLNTAAIGCWALNQKIVWLAGVKRTTLDMQRNLAERMIRAASDGSYSAAFETVFLRDQMALLSTCKDVGPDTLKTLIDAWGKSAWPEWVRLTLTGQAETQWAWALRGGGWASTVSQDGWKGFAEHIQLAHEALEKASKLRPDRPEAAALMITVAMAENAPPTVSRQWFNQAVAAQFDYLPAYTKLMWNYAPRWLGSEQMVLEFGKACAATQRYDTEVPAMIYEACRALAVENANPRGVFSHPLVASAISETAQGYLQHSPASPARHRQLAAHSAIAAWLAGDAKTANESLRVAEGSLLSNTKELRRSLLLHPLGISWPIQAANGGFGPEIQAVDALINNGKLDEARAAIEKIDTTTQASVGAREYVAETRDWLALEGKLKQGGWHPLPVHRSFSTWASTGGNWTTDKDGNLVLYGDDTYLAEILFGLPMPENIQIRGEFVYEPASRDSIGFAWGFGPVLAWQPDSFGRPPGHRGVRGMQSNFDRGQGQAMITSRNWSPPSAFQPMKLREKEVCTFDLCLKNGQATLVANGETTVTLPDVSTLRLEQKHGLLGFSAFRIAPGARVTVRKIEVRIPE